MAGTVLILGGSGRFGRHAAEAFREAGWSVRDFHRGRDDLGSAAAGADVIVNGWNPPYPKWRTELPRLTERVIAAAQASGATVLIPGNVYVFGADAPPVLDEGTPHRAQNPLGRLRIEMEEAYRAAGVPTIILRCGDFIDDARSGNWFDSIITAKPGRVRYPGDPDVAHAWAWLSDAGRAALALAERRHDLATFEDVPFPGWTLSGRQLAEAIGRATGRPQKLARLPWWPLVLARPVWPMARGLVEMRYLWSMPHRLDGAKFDRLVPGFRHTDPVEGLRRAL